MTAISGAWRPVPWARGRVPLAMAGRGPRVEAYASSHAATCCCRASPSSSCRRSRRRPCHGRGGRSPRPDRLVAIPRADERHRGCHPTPLHLRDRGHAAGHSRALGISEATVARVRKLMLTEGIEAAGRHVPPRSCHAQRWSGHLSPSWSSLRTSVDARRRSCSCCRSTTTRTATGSSRRPRRCCALLASGECPSPPWPIDKEAIMPWIPDHRPRGRDGRPCRGLCLAGAATGSADRVHPAGVTGARGGARAPHPVSGERNGSTRR